MRIASVRNATARSLRGNRSISITCDARSRPLARRWRYANAPALAAMAMASVSTKLCVSESLNIVCRFGRRLRTVSGNDDGSREGAHGEGEDLAGIL
eukprot:scaffold12559_cov125-Isochrysis_galbana.AAC.2